MHIGRAINHSRMAYAETVPSWFLLNLRVPSYVNHAIIAERNFQNIFYLVRTYNKNCSMADIRKVSLKIARAVL